MIRRVNVQKSGVVTSCNNITLLERRDCMEPVKPRVQSTGDLCHRFLCVPAPPPGKQRFVRSNWCSSKFLHHHDRGRAFFSCAYSCVGQSVLARVIGRMLHVCHRELPWGSICWLWNGSVVAGAQDVCHGSLSHRPSNREGIAEHIWCSGHTSGGFLLHRRRAQAPRILLCCYPLPFLVDCTCQC